MSAPVCQICGRPLDAEPRRAMATVLPRGETTRTLDLFFHAGDCLGRFLRFAEVRVLSVLEYQIAPGLHVSLWEPEDRTEACA